MRVVRGYVAIRTDLLVRKAYDGQTLVQTVSWVRPRSVQNSFQAAGGICARTLSAESENQNKSARQRQKEPIDKIGYQL